MNLGEPIHINWSVQMRGSQYPDWVVVAHGYITQDEAEIDMRRLEAQFRDRNVPDVEFRVINDV